MRNRVAAAADCHDSLHCITCFDCFDDGDELRQSKDAQHTAPVRLSPVFVAPRRFAIRSLLISFSRFLPAFLPSSSYSFFSLSYLSPFFSSFYGSHLSRFVRWSTERASLYGERGVGGSCHVLLSRPANGSSAVRVEPELAVV